MNKFNSTIRCTSYRLPRPGGKQKPAKSKAVRDAERLFDVACAERIARAGIGICRWPGCDAYSQVRHHALKRRYWNMGLVIPEKAWQLVRFLCDAHHKYAEHHQEEARAKGISFELWEAVERGLARKSNKGAVVADGEQG